MNIDYLGLGSSMAPPARSALRRRPPPSPSRSLIGMEKVIPPGTPSPQKSPLSPAADKDKPLPRRPPVSRRSSSVYSGDSGYTKILDLYTNWNVDDERADNDIAAPIAIQAGAYRQTLTGLLARRFTSSSPISPLTIPHFSKHAVSIPSLRLTSEDSPQTPSAVDSRAAPSFVEFSRSLQAKRSDMVSPLSSLASPHYGMESHDTFWQPSLRSSPEIRAVAFEYEQEHLQGEVSPAITDVVSAELVPPPLDLARSGGSSEYQGRRMLAPDLGSETRLSEQGSSSKFSSTSSSDSSFVVYTGVRESIRAIIRHKLGKKESVDKGRKASANSDAFSPREVPPSNLPEEQQQQQPERKFSWASRRSSVQQGVTNLLRRTLSLTSPSSPTKRSTTPPQPPPPPRVRQKQLAIPLTPYQKYGTAVWHNSQRKKRRQARAARAQQTSTMSPGGGTRTLPAHRNRQKPPSSQRSSEVLAAAFQSGRDQLLSALDETKHKMMIPRTTSNSRSGKLPHQQAPRSKGIAPQGRRGEDRQERSPTKHKLFRSGSEKRREKLKNSIALVGPVDPYAVGEAAATTVSSSKTGPDGEGMKYSLKNSVKLVGAVDEDTARHHGGNWL